MMTSLCRQYNWKIGGTLCDKIAHIAQLVYLNCQNLCSDNSNWMTPLAGSGFKMEEDHLNIKIFVNSVFFIMSADYFYVEIFDSIQKNLSYIPLVGNVSIWTNSKYGLCKKMPSKNWLETIKCDWKIFSMCIF